MRIAEVIGVVTLSRSHPTFSGATLKVALPLSLDNLRDRTRPDVDPIVLWDELGSNRGDWIALSEGAEAAQPFRPEVKPVDAYNAALLDNVVLKEPKSPKRRK